MNLVVYLNPNYIQSETIGESVTNISESAKVAVEVALQYKDDHDANVTALIVGTDADETVLREVYAMGIDTLIAAPDKEYNADNVADIIKGRQFETVVSAEDTARDVAKALGFDVVDNGKVQKQCVLKIGGDEAKPRYMHITRVFNAYEQPIEFI